MIVINDFKLQGCHLNVPLQWIIFLRDRCNRSKNRIALLQRANFGISIVKIERFAAGHLRIHCHKNDGLW